MTGIEKESALKTRDRPTCEIHSLHHLQASWVQQRTEANEQTATRCQLVLLLHNPNQPIIKYALVKLGTGNGGALFLGSGPSFVSTKESF